MGRKLKVGRSPRSKVYVAADERNPNRVIGGYKSRITRLERARSESAEPQKAGGIFEALFGRIIGRRR